MSRLKIVPRPKGKAKAKGARRAGGEDRKRSGGGAGAAVGGNGDEDEDARERRRPYIKKDASMAGDLIIKAGGRTFRGVRMSSAERRRRAVPTAGFSSGRQVGLLTQAKIASRLERAGAGGAVAGSTGIARVAARHYRRTGRWVVGNDKAETMRTVRRAVFKKSALVSYAKSLIGYEDVEKATMLSRPLRQRLRRDRATLLARADSGMSGLGDGQRYQRMGRALARHTRPKGTAIRVKKGRSRRSPMGFRQSSKERQTNPILHGMRPSIESKTRVFASMRASGAYAGPKPNGRRRAKEIAFERRFSGGQTRVKKAARGGPRSSVMPYGSRHQYGRAQFFAARAQRNGIALTPRQKRAKDYLAGRFRGSVKGPRGTVRRAFYKARRLFGPGMIRGGSRAMERRIASQYRENPSDAKSAKRWSALGTLDNRRKGRALGLGIDAKGRHVSLPRRGKYR